MNGDAREVGPGNTGGELHETLSLLAGGKPGEPGRNQAAARLRQFLIGRAGGTLVEPRSHQSYRIVEADREDMVQAVLLKVLKLMTFTPDYLLRLAEPALRSCMDTMLVRCWLSRKRKEKEQLYDPQAAGCPEAVSALPPGADLADPAGPGHRVEQAVQQAYELLRQAYELARSSCRADRKVNLERSWGEAVAQALGPSPSRPPTGETGGGSPSNRGPDPEEQRRARNRVYKEQQRLREDLLRAIDRLVGSGGFSAVQGEAARLFCTLLLRKCQRSEAPSIPAGEGA